MTAWADIAALLAQESQRQLFFVGGPPRAGTTWVQTLLDAHPEISCGGEGLFMKHLAQPIDQLVAARRAALVDKNATVFAHAQGYPLPDGLDADAMIAAGILLALERQRAGKAVRAIGEKTPENVFFFERIKKIFPSAKLIVVSRDPRDVLASSWHMFHRAEHGHDEDAKKKQMIEIALPALIAGTRTSLALGEKYPGDVINITYEALLADSGGVAAQLYAFLGVDHAPSVAADCAARAGFAALSGGRSPGQVDAGSFFRQAVIGGWPDTLSPAMGRRIMDAMAWAFPAFGWQE